MSLRAAVQALTRLNALSKPGGAAARAALVQRPAFHALAALLQSQVAAMNNIQLSNSLYAFSQLRVALPEPTLQAYYAGVLASIATFYPRDISTILAAFAALKARPPADVLDQLGFRAQGHLVKGAFEPQGISMLLNACVQLGYANRMLATAAAQQAAIHIVRFSPQSVSNTMWALARMGVYHLPAVEGALAAFAAAPPDAYRPQETANLLWAMTAWRHHPEAAFGPALRSLLARPEQLRAADVATALYALAFFNMAPGKATVQRLCARAQALLPQANAVELCNMYWGLGLLGESRQDAFAAIEAALPAQFEAGAMQDSLLRMAFQGFLCSKLSDDGGDGADSSASGSPPPRSSGGLPAAMVEAMKRAWVTSMAAAPAQPLVLWVADYVKQLKVRHDVRRPTRDGLVMIDLALRGNNDDFIALQLVAEEERCANTGQMLGMVQLQKALLEKNGWRVKHVMVRDMEKMREEVRPLFLAELLRGAGVRALPADALAAAKQLQAAAAARAEAGAAPARGPQGKGPAAAAAAAGRAGAGARAGGGPGSKASKGPRAARESPQGDADSLMRKTPDVRMPPRKQGRR